MFPRLAVPALALAVLAVAAPTAAAQSERVAMRTHPPASAPDAAVSAHAGEMRDLCAPGERLRREGSGWVCEASGVRLAAAGPATYQTFQLASGTPGATTRFTAACLGAEDRVLAGTCVRRAAGGYVSFAGRATRSDAGEAVECALDGDESSAAVGIAVCLDLPPAR